MCHSWGFSASELRTRADIRGNKLLNTIERARRIEATVCLGRGARRRVSGKNENPGDLQQARRCTTRPAERPVNIDDDSLSMPSGLFSAYGLNQKNPMKPGVLTDSRVEPRNRRYIPERSAKSSSGRAIKRLGRQKKRRRQHHSGILSKPRRRPAKQSIEFKILFLVLKVDVNQPAPLVCAVYPLVLIAIFSTTNQRR